MEMEPIGKVNANVAASETVNVMPSKPVVQTETAAEAQSVTNVAVERSVGQQGGDQQREHAPSEATLDDAVKRANLKMEHTRCEYSYHKDTNRVSIKVINADTDEVVREIPPEKSLDMLQKMWEMAGILVDEKR